MRYIAIVVILFFNISIGYGQYDKNRVNLETTFISCVKYNLMGRQEKAIDTLQILNREYPDNPAILFQLSRSYELNKDYRKSTSYAKQAYNLQPNYTYQKHLGEQALKAEDYNLAVDTWSPLYRKDPANEEYGDKLATAHFLNGDSKNAIKIYDAIESINGIKENTSRRKVEIYDLTGNAIGMEKELIKLSDAYPDNLTYIKNLTKFYRRTGQMDKATAMFEKAKKIDPSIAPMKQKNNNINTAVGDDTVTEVSKSSTGTKISTTSASSYQLSYDDFTGWKEQLESLWNDKQYVKLEHLSFEGLDQFPNESITYYYNGKALNMLKKYAEAEIILSEAVIVATGDDVVQSGIYTELAKSLLAQNKRDSAKSFIEAALALDSNNKEAISLNKKL